MRRVLALFLATSLSGCASFGSAPVAVGPVLPDLDARDVSKCRDPGVPEVATVEDAVSVIGSTRVYAACERKKRENVIATYKNLQKGLRDSP